MVATFVDGDLTFEIPGTWDIADDAHVSHCRSCQAPIMWCTNAASGKRAPFDPVNPKIGVSTSHFASCPDAARWRKR